MNRKIITMLALVSVLLTAWTASAQDIIQPMPGYYGGITVNGQPAASGTTIIAMIAGEVRGSITTTKSGFYGDEPNPDGSSPSKLWITGYTDEIGSTITFYVNNVAAPRTTPLGRNGTRLDLTFAGVTAGGGSSGGNSAGGGGGMVSGEPFENIEFSETQEADLRMGIPVTFGFRDPRHTVYELVITANTSAGMTGAKIEQLKDASRIVTSPPPGTIFRNVNIWLGSSGFAVPGNIREGIVRFRVNNGWLASENIDAGSISMIRWDGSKWISLGTKQVKMDDTFTYYEATTASFSHFAIGGVKAASTPAGVTTPAAGVSPTAAPLAVMPPTNLNWILYVVVAIIIISAVYYYALKRR